jgi:L-gulono-1,4-lactone dehydrogenase
VKDGSPTAGRETIANFGRNVVVQPQTVLRPRSEDDVLQALTANRGQRIRVVGRLHSWSDAVRCDDVILDLRHLDSVQIERRGDETWATIGGGTQIKRVLSELAKHGLTLPTVGLITEQTIAGAISTGTHGSGRHSLSHYIAEVRLAVYDPDSGEPVIRTVNDGPELRAARCSLGCLGVILSVGMRCRHSYRIEEHIRRYDSLDDVLAAEDGFPLQQFFLIPWLWKFFGQHRRESDSPRSRLAALYRLYWFLCIDLGLHVAILLLLRGLRWRALVKSFFRRVLSLTVIRNWRVVDDSWKMLVMKHHLFRHIEIEVFVRRSQLPRAMAFVRSALRVFDGDESAVTPELRSQLQPHGLVESLFDGRGTYTHHYPICIRRVLPDDTLISASSGGDEPWYAISFISYEKPSWRDGFFRFATFLAESTSALFGGRPHWGKFNPMTAASAVSLFPRLPEFRDVCRRFDPAGVFRNAWIDDIVFRDDGGAARSDASTNADSSLDRSIRRR